MEKTGSLQRPRLLHAFDLH